MYFGNYTLGLFLLATASVTMSALSAEFSKKNAQFSIDLYSKVIAETEEDKNVIISPLSVQTCVALAYAGATGETAKEMATGLKLVSEDPNEVAESFGHLLENYKDSKLVKIANKVYVNELYHVKGSFNEIATKYFHSEADTINVSNPSESADKVNQWVEEKTNNKIQNLISPDIIDELTRLILVNAIYFKGNWAKKFDPEFTEKEPFYMNESDSVDVDMMKQKSKFRYGVFDDLDCSALEMQYADSDLSMLILLPNSRTGLRSLEHKLKERDLIELAENMYETEVIVSVPKFKADFSITLNKPLKEMGMEKMFSETAEFGNLLEEDDDLYVSKVVHKAFIEVNEEGTEAAAATGMIMMMRCQIPFDPVTFTAEHPFVYALWDKKTILFSGKVVKLE